MGFGVLLALTLPVALEIGTDEQELAATALGVCVVQGVALWAMRRWRRRARQAIVAELREMLKDRINSHLTVVLISVTHRRDHALSDHDREMLESAVASTHAVARTLDELSEDSLRLWERRYGVKGWR